MIKKKATSTSRKAIIIVATIILAIAIPASIIKVYKVTTVNELRQLAYQFKPDDSWVKTGEYSNEPNLTWLGCIDSVCPMYEISWDTHRVMTTDELTQLIHASGWDSKIEGDCLPNEVVGGRGTACASKVISGDYSIVISYKNDSGDPDYRAVNVKVTKTNES